MDKNIQRFERIRSYILGKMSVEEAVDFEGELNRDEELYSEYEMLKDISEAVVKVNSEEELRSLFSKAEAEQRTNPAFVDKKKLKEELKQVERDLAKLDRIEGQLSQNKIKAWFTPGSFEYKLSYPSRLVVSFAIAASLALAVILPINNHHMVVSGYEEAGRLLESSSWQYSNYRGDDSITELVNSINLQIHERKYQDALKTIGEAEVSIEKELSSISGDETAFSRLSELKIAKQNVEWSKAVLLMHEKEVRKAKRLLKQIAESDSPFSQEAERILKSYYREFIN